MYTIITLFILLFPTFCYATTWSEVVNFIATAEAANPDCLIWQENYLSEAGAGIRVYKRCDTTSIARTEYKTTGGVTSAHSADWVFTCDGANGQNRIAGNYGDHWINGSATNTTVNCGGGASVTEGWAAIWRYSQTCNVNTVAGVDCTSGDILIGEWSQIDDDACAITLISTGRTEYTYINIGENVNGPCECEPKGWIGEEVTPDVCTYHFILGDPVPPDTIYGDTVNGTVVTTPIPPIPPGTIGDDGGMTGGTVTGTTTSTTTTTADTTTTTTTDGGTPVVEEVTETITETTTQETAIEVPVIAAVDSNKFNTNWPVLTESDWSSLITGWISTNPLSAVISGTHLDISGSSCLVGPVTLSVPHPGGIWTKDVSLNFCVAEPWLDLLGTLFVGVAGIYSVYVLIGRS